MIARLRGFALRIGARLLPNLRVLNYLLMAPHYNAAQGRYPRGVNAPDATINDYIFARAIDPKRSVLQQACSDKEYAKIIARGMEAKLRAAETVAIYKLNRKTVIADVERWLRPYLGQRLVLKPAHSNGHIIFLDQPLDKAKLGRQLEHAKRNYFSFYRESQYINLETRLILERYIETTDRINDLKFFCAAGQVLLCQIDCDRFTHHTRAFFAPPDFHLLDIKWKDFDRPHHAAKPENMDELARIASALSKPFEFVRIDLYNTREGIFFGEFTFTPGVGMNKLSDEKLAIDLLRQVRAAA